MLFIANDLTNIIRISFWMIVYLARVNSRALILLMQCLNAYAMHIISSFINFCHIRRMF